MKRGASVGRYVILEELGHGGMGVVYAAYDPELDRKVALKLLLPEPLKGTDAATGQARLVREAQAIARIDHPNVVSVHDVGRFESAAFVAMEFVDGVPLSRWTAERRPVAEIVAMFAAAGRGLAAAHAQGVIHRDFKPDNVLVDRRGRPRVVDFGLARRSSTTPVADQPSRNTPGASTLDVDLTAAGSVMGTPAYMAPEQYKAGAVDARTDQFGFCVALYEALYGERPFAGERMGDIVSNVCDGRVSPPPEGSEVSPQLRRVLLRGLRANPTDRFASMTELLHELAGSGRGGRRRTLVFAGLGALAVGLVGFVVRMTTAERDPCHDAGTAVEPLWTAERAARVEQAFAATGLAYAREAFVKTRGALDSYANAWTETSKAVCVGVRVAREETEDTLALQDACLRRGLLRFGAWIELLETADAQLVEEAVKGTHALPSPGECRAAERLRTGVRGPDGPALLAKVDAIDGELVEVLTLIAAGRLEAAETRARAATKMARAVGYPPIHAKAVHILSDVVLTRDEEGGMALLYEAFATALEARDDALAAKAALDLGYEHGYHARQADSGDQWLDVGEALIGRVGGAPQLELGLINNRAILHAMAGHTDAAREQFERGLALQRTLEPESPNLAMTLANLGAFSASRGEDTIAMEYLDASIELEERTRGSRHPSTLRARASAGTVALMAGDYADAAERLRTSLAGQRASLGENHPDVARTMAALGVAENHLDNLEEAAKLERRALKIREERLGGDHPSVAESLRFLAAVLVKMAGKGDEAVSLGQRALALMSTRVGPDHPDTARAHLALAYTYVELERWLGVQTHAGETVRIHTAAAPDSRDLIAPLRLLGNARRELGHAADAQVSFERALELAIADGDRREIAACKFALARTLVVLAEPERAISLAQAAHDALASLPQAGERTAEIAAWIADQRGR